MKHLLNLIILMVLGVSHITANAEQISFTIKVDDPSKVLVLNQNYDEITLTGPETVVSADMSPYDYIMIEAEEGENISAVFQDDEQIWAVEGVYYVMNITNGTIISIETGGASLNPGDEDLEGNSFYFYVDNPENIIVTRLGEYGENLGSIENLNPGEAGTLITLQGNQDIQIDAAPGAFIQRIYDEYGLEYYNPGEPLYLNRWPVAELHVETMKMQLDKTAVFYIDEVPSYPSFTLHNTQEINIVPGYNIIPFGDDFDMFRSTWFGGSVNKIYVNGTEPTSVSSGSYTRQLEDGDVIKLFINNQPEIVNVDIQGPESDNISVKRDMISEIQTWQGINETVLSGTLYTISGENIAVTLNDEPVIADAESGDFNVFVSSSENNIVISEVGQQTEDYWTYTISIDDPSRITVYAPEYELLTLNEGTNNIKFNPDDYPSGYYLMITAKDGFSVSSVTQDGDPVPDIYGEYDVFITKNNSYIEIVTAEDSQDSDGNQFILYVDDTDNVVVYKGLADDYGYELLNAEPLVGLESGEDGNIIILEDGEDIMVVAADGARIISMTDNTGYSYYQAGMPCMLNRYPVETLTIITEKINFDKTFVLYIDEVPAYGSFSLSYEIDLNLNSGYNVIPFADGLETLHCSWFGEKSKAVFINGNVQTPDKDSYIFSSLEDGDVIKMYLKENPTEVRVNISYNDRSEVERQIDAISVKRDIITEITDWQNLEDNVLSGTAYTIMGDGITVMHNGNVVTPDPENGQFRVDVYDPENSIEIKKNVFAGVQTLENDDEMMPVFNLQGIKVGVKSELDKLPAGIYILNHKKVIKK